MNLSSHNLSSDGLCAEAARQHKSLGQQDQQDNATFREFLMWFMAGTAALAGVLVFILAIDGALHHLGVWGR